MTSSDRNYDEGDVFIVPLPKGGTGVGVVARIGSVDGPILGYFFERADEDPLLEVEPAGAVLIARVGDLGLIEQRWRVVGRVSGWSREKWPMPPFGRVESLTDRALRVDFADDPAADPTEVPVDPEEIEDLFHPGLYGATALEITLQQILDQRP